MNKRVALGIIAVAFLLVAGIYYLSREDINTSSVFANSLLRVGLVLGAICLAWPTLEKLGKRLPLIVNVAALIGLTLMAFRPRVGSILVGLLVLGFIVHFAMRFVVRRSSTEKKEK